MTPTPLYRPENIDSPSFKLRYTWTGWPSTGSFPPQPDQGFFDTLEKALETDGIRVLEKLLYPDKLQYTHVNHYVSLREPTATNRGRYWYDLHLVLVTEQRERFVDEVSLNRRKTERSEEGLLVGQL